MAELVVGGACGSYGRLWTGVRRVVGCPSISELLDEAYVSCA